MAFGLITGVAAASLWSSSPVSAATFTVTSAADDGSVGTLRDAITQANASAGADVISVGAVGSIALVSALPQITEDLTITGPGASSATIDGGGFQVFKV